jgi:hypothetical protein
VITGLRWHQPDGVARHVRHVRHQDGDSPAHRHRERLEQVADVHRPGRQVAPRAGDRRRIDVRGVQLEVGRRSERGADGPGTAAEVDDHRPGPDEGGGLADQELGASTRHEHARVHRDPQAAELRPAEQVLQGLPGDPPSDQKLQRCSVPCPGHQQPGLFLGEHAAGGAQPSDDRRLVERGRNCGHAASRGRRSDGTAGGGRSRRARIPS